MGTTKSPPEIRLLGNVSRAAALSQFPLADCWPDAPGQRKSSRWMGRVSLAAFIVLGGLLTMTAGCASSGGLSIANSGVPDRSAYTSREGFIRQQKNLDLEVVRRRSMQERLEFNRREAERRAVRWEKLQRMLAAAKSGRKETL